MPTQFLESLGGQLAERWMATLFTPALVFWLGGLAAWIQQFGWDELETWLNAQSEPIQITLIAGSLLLVAASAFIVQQLELPALQVLEGYWPVWLSRLRRYGIRRQRQILKRKEQRWQQLARQREQQGLTPAETDDYIRLDWQLRQFPSQPGRLMPTRLGNLLRAAEDLPQIKYGLDAILCWPRLWMLLPEPVKTDLQAARAELNTAARVWLWGLCFLVWWIWAWWAFPIGLLIAWFAYRWLLRAAATYATLLESAFDLHRLALYQSLRWPLPTNPAEEQRMGQQLTAYLWRGSDSTQPKFVLPQQD
ncbi:MAG: hypothetical protein F6J97_09145 [Leptolyngbya sp. SIO4C1]|nr:hypothetical protein [Leptolyngbya sp. SIO4C1]